MTAARMFRVECADCLEWLPTLPADSVDLCLFSPPYEAARTYSIGFNKRGQEWVDWMVRVFTECRRVCNGLVACVCEGQTRNYRWSATPALLMADLHRAGFVLRKPPAFCRVGIPGSGGPDWWRNDYEFIVCTTRGGKLPWSDNTATGHPPKWAPGGEMSHMLPTGERVNARSKLGKTGHGGTMTKNGTRDHRERPSHRLVKTGAVCGRKDGDTEQNGVYAPPVLANPGNLLREKVGGGLMGHPLAHENEAPYPLTLCEKFVRSFCPPGGVCLDPFTGSGTTGHAAVLWQRQFIGCDVRQSQVDLTMRRLSGVTPMMLL